MCPPQKPIKILRIVNVDLLGAQVRPELIVGSLWATKEKIIDVDRQEQSRFLDPIRAWMIWDSNPAAGLDGLVKVRLPMAAGLRMAIEGLLESAARSLSSLMDPLLRP